MTTLTKKTMQHLSLACLISSIFLFFFAIPAYAQEEEMKATWISYINWAELPTEQKAFEKEVDAMMQNCRNLGLNTVFVHAHSHSDSYYAGSQLFPPSKFTSGIQGKESGYDPFGYVVKSAHDHGLKIHAWFNPYRVTGYLMPWDQVSESNPAKQWWNSTEYHRYVLKHEGEYYLNPSKPEVIDKIVASVAEVVNRYDIDGIQFDDYFYPYLNDANPETSFDKAEYEASGSSKSITQWRRDNVSSLVSKVRAEIKAIDPEVVFGISPQGSLENLHSNHQLFVDINLWLESDQYVDYIMPQLYWGFETKTASGLPASYAFENNLKLWTNLTANSPVKLYLGLGLYKGGSTIADGNPVSEWQRSDNIIAREVQMARKTGKVGGFSFYSYQSFFDEASKKETKNLLEVLSN